MTETLSGQTGASEVPLTIGEAVSITRGALCGLQGTLQAFTAGRRCVLALDGIADGVQIVIGCECVAPSGMGAAIATGSSTL